jgi:hypothetical protein
VLAPRSQRRITVSSLGLALGGLGVRGILIHDADAQSHVDRFMKKHSVGKRNQRCVRTDEVQVTLSRKFFKKIGAMGGTKSRANMGRAQATRLARNGAAARAASLSPAQRSDIARRAVRARWARARRGQGER